VPRSVQSETFFSLPFSVGQVWPILSKTDWVNRAIGLPPVQYDVTRRAEGGSWVRARARLAGLECRWQELPFEWVEERFYRVRRIFENGPLLEAVLGVEFEAAGNKESTVRVFSEIQPRHWLGEIFARHVLSRKGGQDMGRVIEHIRKKLLGAVRAEMPRLPRTPARDEVLGPGLQRLRESGAPEHLVGRIEGMLREWSDVEVSRIRPFAVAREWDADRWEVLTCFLKATRCGLLQLSWEVLCPNCRSSRELVTSLAVLRGSVHCEVCQIQYGAEFDRSVELKFSAHPAVRPFEPQTFCLGGPGTKPHIVSQLFLAPGERRQWELPALAGSHRLRSPQVQEPFPCVEGAGNGAAVSIQCLPARFEGAETWEPAAAGRVEICNPNAHAVQVVLERTGWSEDILTAARVTNWQDFRDLFTTEVISPDEQIIVGEQVVLFTDLRGSTAMYCGIGDAPAYAIVRNHFVVLQEVIRARHGTVVKTIGDAVMAVFSQVDEALQAVVEMHRSLREADLRAGQEPLLLKSGLHVGPCLAVNANDKLDYFGTTINLGARLVSCCKGGDLTVSDSLYERGDAAGWLRENVGPPEVSEVQFRGFATPTKVWRVRVV
jgi:class 3 adenylate cyclase